MYSESTFCMPSSIEASKRNMMNSKLPQGLVSFVARGRERD